MSENIKDPTNFSVIGLHFAPSVQLFFSKVTILVAVRTANVCCEFEAPPPYDHSGTLAVVKLPPFLFRKAVSEVELHLLVGLHKCLQKRWIHLSKVGVSVPSVQ